MTLSEAQTRREIIDKRLAKAGWDVKDPSMVTEELDIISDINKAAGPQDKYSGHLFSDYALLGKILHKKKAIKIAFCGPTWARTRDPLIMSQVL